MAILLIGLLASLLVGGFVVYADVHALSPHGSSGALFFRPFVLLLVPVGLGVLLLGFASTLFPRTRGVGVAMVVVALVLLVAIFQSIRLSKAVRSTAFAALADRARPIINAIECYQEEFGAPPQSLQSLVPNYLPAIPRTGMGAYPEFRYVINPALYDGNPWVLKVFTPSGILNFDEFFYYPQRNYPDRRCGNRVERIADWAYLHE